MASESKQDVIEPTERTTIRRLPKRQVVDKERVYAALDAGVICTVGMVANGSPRVIPTGYVRLGDYVYLHGKKNSFLVKYLSEGNETCVTVTHLDGFVISRAAFHHSVNYRSVCVFGRAEVVTDEAERMEALERFTNSLIPGRWDDCRLPTPAEMIPTAVVRLPLTEVSCKIRTGEPSDDAADMDSDYWAGVIPMAMVSFPPQPASDLKAGLSTPAHIARFDRIPDATAAASALGVRDYAAGASLATRGQVEALTAQVAKLTALVDAASARDHAAASGSAFPMWLLYVLGVVLAVAFTQFYK